MGAVLIVFHRGHYIIIDPFICNYRNILPGLIIADPYFELNWGQISPYQGFKDET